MPEVSVVLCVYNTARYIGEAVDSIQKQEGADFELIVIDDCSTDGSHDIVADMIKDDARCRIIRLEQNQGLAGAMNVGIKEAKAPLLAQIDSDDVALPGRLATQRDALAAHPDIHFLGSGHYFIGAESQLLSPDPTILAPDSDLIAWRLSFGNQLANPTMMSRTDALRANPYTREEMFRWCVDYELWCRVNWHYKFTNILTPLMKYRMHQKQGSIEYSVLQNKAALECGRRCASELLGEEVLTVDMGRVHDIANQGLAINTDEYKQSASLLTKMLVAFMRRKAEKGESMGLPRAIIDDYIIRSRKLAAATNLPPEQLTALLEEQKAEAQGAIESMAASLIQPRQARAGAQ